MKGRLDIYTSIKRMNDDFLVSRNVKKMPSNTDGRSKVDVTPFIPLEFIQVDGEHIGDMLKNVSW